MHTEQNVLTDEARSRVESAPSVFDRQLPEAAARVERVLAELRSREGGIRPIACSELERAIVIFSDPNSGVTSKRMAKAIINAKKRKPAVRGKKHYMYKRKMDRHKNRMRRLRKHSLKAWENFRDRHKYKRSEYELLWTKEEYFAFQAWQDGPGSREPGFPGKRAIWYMYAINPELKEWSVQNCYVRSKRDSTRLHQCAELVELGKSLIRNNRSGTAATSDNLKP